MHRYTAYGLTVTSDCPLPELEEAERQSGSDATIVRGRIDQSSASGVEGSTLLWANRGDVCLRYDRTGTFRIRNGSEIQVEPFEGADDRAIRLLLLGPALAVLLHQRGLLVLHASAVSFGASVAAFVGEKGEGKSTLAAALHARGHPLVADDLVAVELDDSSVVRVRAGFPQLKLGPDVLVQLGEDAETFPRLHPDYDKRARPVSRMASDRSLSLARVYVLESGESHLIEPLAPQQTFVELVRHSYLAELLPRTDESESHFNQIVALASRVPVRRLRRRRDLATLPEVAMFVESEFALTRASPG